MGFGAMAGTNTLYNSPHLFIAWHMMYERMAPLLPMSAPTEVSRSLLSVKPSAARA